MSVWLITGSNRGLGRAFAEEALKKGNQVIAAARRPDPSDPFYSNDNVLGVRMDVTDAGQPDGGV